MDNGICRVKSMGRACLTGLMALTMKVHGKMIWQMAGEFWCTPMVMFIQDIGWMTRLMVLEAINIQTVHIIQASGSKINSMV